MMNMKKIVGMIPARMGSQRVPMKNLRLLAGKPLIAHATEAAAASKAFDEIYINSEAEIFEEISRMCGVRYYRRPEHLASNKTINDEFVLDFIQNVPGDILIQILPTSPLITPEEIASFVSEMAGGDYDTLVSVQSHRIACVHEGKPVNFNLLDPHRSSQEMTPVESYATALMGWTCLSFLGHIQTCGSAYHGANGKTGYFPLKGLSTIDVDTEDDFRLAEVAMAYKLRPHTGEVNYYKSSKETGLQTEIHVPDILKKDGIVEADFGRENQPLINLDDVIAQKDNSRSWCHRIVNTENNSATLISQMPGEGNRLHYHPDWNEWWYIVSGTWKWEIDGKETIVKKADVVFIEKNKWHRITAMGDKPAVRLAISKDGVSHVYPAGTRR